MLLTRVLIVFKTNIYLGPCDLQQVTPRALRSSKLEDVGMETVADCEHNSIK